ncbi:MAG: hypothetical protein EAX86_02600 [Candidatus Heimdallarchaeota archaeon]|nr:hypothetical protein [Candidatus Heimdallarchaeota archaeon]
MAPQILIRSPGRICLFGEHQDYLNLPVIPMAINMYLNLKCTIEAQTREKIYLSSDQFNQDEIVFLKNRIYLNDSPFDYLKSVLVFFGVPSDLLTLSKIQISSDIPIKSGLSSSAAILTAMVHLVGNELLKKQLSPKEVAEIAYECEHDLMKISCGRMDQYSVAFGGIIHMTADSNPVVTTLEKINQAYFIIGNSGVERKADIPLKTVQKDIFEGLNILGNPDLNDAELNGEKIRKLSNIQLKRLKGVFGVRDNLRLAFEELKKPDPSISYLGNLLTEQQTFLREDYEVSHPKLDKMCDIALKYGALGCKLSGAGFGGSMFALAGERETALIIKRRLEEFGPSFITEVSEGTKRIY